MILFDLLIDKVILLECGSNMCTRLPMFICHYIMCEFDSLKNHNNENIQFLLTIWDYNYGE